ncbi:protein kinase [Anaeramoeba flamelloides]|uniref:Protein kinase n=1 Tax=Anaeramoeba flamelloides TaxID=1746091 RepID=A0AAV7Y9C4_9EUKA|nr:protein kinase [Anaeramoeba flamelloides]
MSLETIGPYTIGRTLGKGSFAKVKLATHNKTKQKVAIKIIQKGDISNSQNLLQKVRREIAVQRLMKHPNVLRIYDVYETTEHLFIILEYVSGGNFFVSYSFWIFVFSLFFYSVFFVFTIRKEYKLYINFLLTKFVLRIFNLFLFSPRSVFFVFPDMKKISFCSLYPNQILVAFQRTF